MRAIHFSLNLYSSIKTVGATVSSGQIDLASDLFKNYILYGVGNASLHVTYFPTNLVYPFTLRVTGITINTIHLYTRTDLNKI